MCARPRSLLLYLKLVRATRVDKQLPHHRRRPETPAPSARDTEQATAAIEPRALDYESHYGPGERLDPSRPPVRATEALVSCLRSCAVVSRCRPLLRRRLDAPSSGAVETAGVGWMELRLKPRLDRPAGLSEGVVAVCSSRPRTGCCRRLTGHPCPPSAGYSAPRRSSSHARPDGLERVSCGSHRRQPLFGRRD